MNTQLDRRTPVRAYAWMAYLAAGLLAIVQYAVEPAGTSATALYVGIGLSAPAAVVWGLAVHRPTRRLWWCVVGVAQVLWVVGHVDPIRYADPALHFPTAADGGYVVAYPVLAVGLMLLMHRRLRIPDGAELLDTTIITAGIGLLAWVLFVRPIMTRLDGSLAAASVGLAYPVFDIVLAAVIIRLVTTASTRSPALNLVVLAVALLAIGDVVAGVRTLAYVSNAPIYDVFWLGSFVAWGAAALHPSMRNITEPGDTGRRAVGSHRLFALMLATLVAPGTLAVELVLGMRLDGWAVVVGSVVLCVLVVARMKLAIDQIVAANRQRERLQESLAFQAAHDSLTRLPNRAQALRLMDSALSRAQRSGAIIGLLFIDLDEFKAINDTYGHRTGDQVLCAVAERMHAQVRAGDVLARLGGDEFLVLLEPVDSQASVVDVAERLVAAASEPIAIAGGRTVTVGASVGVAISLDGMVDPVQLLADADAAVYRAKSSGRGHVEVFDETLRRELSERAELEAAIEAGLATGEFVVHYQPVVHVTSGRTEGYEALIRWEHPTRGLLLPGEFIPTAEASTLICDVDCWVLHEALAQLAKWSVDTSTEQLRMAVNISGRHISSPARHR